MSKKEEGPDQARSWAIALAACVINTMLSGISRTSGLFYVALIETYGVTRLQANLPFTLRNVIRNLGGPLAGAIGQRYGAQEVTIVGGVFASLGIILCHFAPNVIWIAILWGGMHGFGVALGNTLFSVTVNHYFLKYRATASGLALSGACVGSFVFPVALEYMLTNLGLPGTFLITGACVMHVLPAGILMKEPPWIRKQLEARKEIQQKATVSPRKEKTAPSKQSMYVIREEPSNAPEVKDPCVMNLRKIPSTPALDVDEATCKKDGQLSSDKNGQVIKEDGVDNPAFVGSWTELSGKIADQEPEEFIFEPRMRSVSSEMSITIPVSPTDVKQETSLSKASKKVFLDPMFHVISLSLAAFAMVFDPAITVIVDYFKDKGLEEDTAKYFISMMSLGDLLGRLCFGWVTDRKYLSIPKFMMLLHLIQGVCFLLLPLFYTFDLLMTLIVIYGMASGATLVMFPVLVSKYLASVQSLAIGFISIFSGVLSLAIPPLIGYFRDDVGSYDGMFFITGGMSAITALVWLLEPLILKLKKSRRSASVAIST